MTNLEQHFAPQQLDISRLPVRIHCLSTPISQPHNNRIGVLQKNRTVNQNASALLMSSNLLAGKLIRKDAKGMNQF